MADKQLTIDPEFRELCRALTPEERNLLEASIEADGCRDAIVTWANHDDTILDGHNRFEICTQLEKPWKSKALNLPDRQACIEWIIANQLGRRNATEEEKSFLRGKRYRSEKKAPHRPEKDATAAPLKTAERLAEEYGVSSRTIHNDADFADAVDSVAANVGTEAKTEILSGKSGLTKKQIQDVAALPEKQQPKAYVQAKAGEKANGSPAVKRKVDYPLSTAVVKVLGDIVATLNLIREDHGNALAMFNDPKWDGSQTCYAVQMIRALRKTFTDMDEELKRNGK